MFDLIEKWRVFHSWDHDNIHFEFDPDADAFLVLFREHRLTDWNSGNMDHFF